MFVSLLVELSKFTLKKKKKLKMATGGKKPAHIEDATKADLLSIRSIGEAKADRILNLREENGGTLTLHDLQKSKVVSNSAIKKLQHSGFIIFSGKKCVS